jgi:uncharacterized protein YecE (DUF72 family)
MLRPENEKPAKLRVGTAAWTLPKEALGFFPAEGTHLERYSKVLNSVEINSSFYRHHKAVTYKKWSDSVPKDFKFSVKLSKIFTHQQELKVDPKELEPVLGAIGELGEKWEALLVQLPPSLAFDEGSAEKFFTAVRRQFSGLLALEPRHETWVSDPALALQKRFSLTHVHADPSPLPVSMAGDRRPLGSAYFRLHGSPEIYKSNYETHRLEKFYTEIAKVKDLGFSAWCIFDNTTFGFATLNALEFMGLHDKLSACVNSEKISRAAGPAAM